MIFNNFYNENAWHKFQINLKILTFFEQVFHVQRSSIEIFVKKKKFNVKFKIL